MADMELHSGKPYLLTMRDADKNRILIQYNAIGCIDTEVGVEPRFTSERGVVDLLYKINEGEPYLLGELEINGNDRTRDKVIRREAVQAGLLPGEILDKNRLEIYKRRLTMLGYFANDPEKRDKQIRVEIKRRRPPDQPYGDLMIPRLDQASQSRMQDPGVTQARMQDPAPGADGPTVGVPVPDPLPPSSRGARGRRDAWPAAAGREPVQPAGGQPAARTSCRRSRCRTPPPGVAAGRAGPRRTGRAAPGQPPVGAGEPPGSFPSIPGMGMTNVGPDRNDPFPNRSYADVITSIEEAPTGRFMVSVGANSFQGLMGSIQIYEKNFDLFNPPKTWNDFVTSKAFRGGGQEFRIFLQAGTLINYMQISLRDPYLFDLPIGAGVSGYLFQRLYPNWDERRGGGRVNIGRQIGTMTYLDFSAWAEEVDFFGYRTPAPAELPGGQRLHPVVRDHAEPPDRQPEQPVHAHQGAVRELLGRAGIRHVHVHQVRRGRSDVPADLSTARTARASSSSPSAATSASPPSRPRSTSGSSPATSAASAASSTGRSARTPSASRPAAS